MPNDSQYGQSFFFDNFDDAPAQRLPRVRLEKGSGEDSLYSEAWLQHLIMQQPTLLPVEQIESAFTGLVPICMELPVASGFLDNLLVTSSGNLALVECKLWRNPESRREVVGQIIDYATEMARWSYEKLEEAIHRTKPLNGHAGRQNLYERVSADGEIDETQFVDNVSRNLRLGRFLLLIVGDGIQEGVLRMGEYLQQHAGLHFTLGLVEVAFFRLPTGGHLAQPRVFARTTNIARGVVTFDDARVAIQATPQASAISARKMSITEEQYLEGQEQKFAGISARLHALFEQLAEYSVSAEFGSKSMVLRWFGDDAKSWNLGTVASSGEVWFDYMLRQAATVGVLEQAERLLINLAKANPGAYVRSTPKGNALLVGADGRCIKVDSLLADEGRVRAWVQAISDFQSEIVHARK